MTTAREVVAQAIRVYDDTESMDLTPYLSDYYENAADAVLAALWEHWTSDETDAALERYGIYATGRDVVRVLFEEG